MRQALLFHFFCLLILPLSANGAISCKELFRNIPKHEAAQYEAFGKQVTYRGIQEYDKILGETFSEIIAGNRSNKNFRWLDAGGGAGVAGLESLLTQRPNTSEAAAQGQSPIIYSGPIQGRYNVDILSIENILGRYLDMSNREVRDHLAELDEFIRMESFVRFVETARSLNSEQFNYISGKSILEYKDGELGHYDLVTDLFGPLTYSSKKVDVLIKFTSMLRKGGKAILLFNDGWDVFKDSNGQDMLFSQLLTRAEIPGLLMPIEGPIPLKPGGSMRIHIQKEDGTIEALSALAQKIEFHGVVEDAQAPHPHFMYSYSD